MSGLLVGPLLPVAVALAPTKVDTGAWQVNGRIRQILETADAVYLAGDFSTLIGPSGQTLARGNLAALDPATGTPLPFNPGMNKPVWTLAVSPDGSTLYAGGDFTNAAGVTRRKAAAFLTATGALTGWNPDADQRVTGLAAQADRVFIGGEFGLLKGAARSHLAAVNSGTGAVIPSWVGTADDTVNDITLSKDARRVLVGGLFTSISGSAGAAQRKIASLDPVSGQLQPWADHPNFEVFDIEVTDSQVFAAAGGSGGHALGFDVATGQQQWLGFADGDSVTVAYQNGVVYVGGHFTKWQGLDASHIVALQATTGVRLTWNIQVNSALGVFALEAASGHLSVGGDFTRINFLPRQHYARFVEAVDTTAPTVPGQPTGLVSSAVDVDLSWAASTDDRASTIIYRIYRDGGPTPVGEIDSASTGQVTFTDTGLAPGSTHTWTVRATDGVNVSGASPASDPVTLPASQAPLLTSLQMFDANANGKVDRLVATFSAGVTCTAPCTAPWTLSQTPSGGRLGTVAVAGTTATLTLVEGSGAASTAVGAATVALAGGANGVIDAERDAASFAPTAPADRAGPVPMDISSVNNGALPLVMEVGDTFTATFSEPIDPASVIAANVKQLDPPGTGNDAIIIVGLTDGPLDLASDAFVVPDGGTIVYQGSTLTMLSGNTKIRSTIAGPCSGTACGQAGPGEEKVVTLRPEPFLRDMAGNAATGARTESEGLF